MEAAPTFYETADAYSVDARGLTDFWAFTTVKHLGAGQFYLLTIRDKHGQPLDGSKTYRINVPAKAPAKQYWSCTVYDRATHAFIREIPRTGRSSQTAGLKTNDDGTVDIHFGPEVPKGQEANWVPTKPGGMFEVLFRVYGPEKRWPGARHRNGAVITAGDEHAERTTWLAGGRRRLLHEASNEVIK